MTELEGFEIFTPTGPFFICAGDKAIRICADAYRALGMPEYVNVFLDDVKKRIMLKVAKKDYENAMKVIKHSHGMNMNICYKALAVKIADMYGQGNRVYGHLVSDGMMVFDRSKE